MAARWWTIWTRWSEVQRKFLPSRQEPKRVQGCSMACLALGDPHAGLHRTKDGIGFWTEVQRSCMCWLTSKGTNDSTH
jgi:hypothetical protein